MPTLGFLELVALLFVGLLFFGNRIPSIARYVGQGVMELKKAVEGKTEEAGPNSTTAV